MGTSQKNKYLLTEEKDHPHAYGDKFFNTAGSAAGVGSSPRVWGQDQTPEYCKNASRIIPTRMGTSTLTRLQPTLPWDHTHAYGDKTKEIKENSGFAKSTA